MSSHDTTVLSRVDRVVPGGDGTASPLLARIGLAVLVVIGGIVHLRLYSAGGYEAIPAIGPMFLANVVASALIATAVLARPSRMVHVAGLALSVGSLLALLLTHTVGIAGFTEATLSTDQIVSIVTEVSAAAGFGWLLGRSR